MIWNGRATLKMPANILEGRRIPVKIECSHASRTILTLTDLFFEKLREVGGCSKNLSTTQRLKGI